MNSENVEARNERCRTPFRNAVHDDPSAGERSTGLRSALLTPYRLIEGLQRELERFEGMARQNAALFLAKVPSGGRNHLSRNARSHFTSVRFRAGAGWRISWNTSIACLRNRGTTEIAPAYALDFEFSYHCMYSRINKKHSGIVCTGLVQSGFVYQQSARQILYSYC